MRRDFDSNKFAIQVLAPNEELDIHSSTPSVLDNIDCENVRDGVLLINCGDLEAVGGFAVGMSADTAWTDVEWLYGGSTTFETLATTLADAVNAYALADLRKYVRVRLHTGSASADLGITLVGWNRVNVPVT